MLKKLYMEQTLQYSNEHFYHKLYKWKINSVECHWLLLHDANKNWIENMF